MRCSFRDNPAVSVMRSWPSWRYLYSRYSAFHIFNRQSQTPATPYLNALSCFDTVTSSLVLLLHNISKQLEMGRREGKSSCGVTAVLLSLIHHDVPFFRIHYLLHAFQSSSCNVHYMFFVEPGIIPFDLYSHRTIPKSTQKFSTP